MLARIQELKASANTSVFVMMRYREDAKLAELEAAIRSALEPFGLQARLARDAALREDLWKNIVLYMNNSRYGIAVFEELEDSEFNPNISMELGYMLARRRRCLLLKDRRMRALPSDICGKIYRNFDPYHIRESVLKEVSYWCSNDLGLPLLSSKSPEAYPTELEKRIAAEGDLSLFRNRRDMPEGVRMICHEFEDGESKYIVWHDAERRLYKYCKAGPRWFSPERLSSEEERKVESRVFRRHREASNPIGRADG